MSFVFILVAEFEIRRQFAAIVAHFLTRAGELKVQKINCNWIGAKNKHKRGFVQGKWQDVRIFLRSCWYCKTPFRSHIPEETDEGFQFVCFYQGVFFFYAGMRSRSALSSEGVVITQCLSVLWVIFWNLWHFLTAVINCINVQSRAGLEI